MQQEKDRVGIPSQFFMNIQNLKIVKEDPFFKQ